MGNIQQKQFVWLFAAYRQFICIILPPWWAQGPGIENILGAGLETFNGLKIRKSLRAKSGDCGLILTTIVVENDGRSGSAQRQRT